MVLDTDFKIKFRQILIMGKANGNSILIMKTFIYMIMKIILTI